MLGGESSFLYWFLIPFLFYCGLIRFFFFLVSLNGTAHSISRLRSLSLVDSRWERKDISTKSFRLPVNATELICIARDALKLLSLTLPSCQELQKHSFRPLSHPLYDERLLSGVKINKPVLRPHLTSEPLTTRVPRGLRMPILKRCLEINWGHYLLETDTLRK